MRHFSPSSRANRRICACLAATLVSLGAASGAKAALVVVYTLTDGNAATQFDLEAQIPQDSFTVNGTQELASEGFYFSTGSGSPEALNYAPLHSVTQALPNTLDLDYQTSQVDINVGYLLTGGVGDGAASLAETIKLTNLSSDTSLPVHFFEYDNFTLDNSTTNFDVISDGNTADQVGPAGTKLEVTASPTPNEYDTGIAPTLLNELNGSSPVTLGDNAGPTGPGNVEFAFEWDPTIAASDSFIISKVKTITPASPVPLPASAWMGLATLAGLGLVGVARRRTVNG